MLEAFVRDLRQSLRMFRQSPAFTLAAACGVLLYVRGFYTVLGALTGLYLLAAITPWLMVFHSL